MSILGKKNLCTTDFSYFYLIKSKDGLKIIILIGEYHRMKQRNDECLTSEQFIDFILQNTQKNVNLFVEDRFKKPNLQIIPSRLESPMKQFLNKKSQCFKFIQNRQQLYTLPQKNPLFNTLCIEPYNGRVKYFYSDIRFYEPLIRITSIFIEPFYFNSKLFNRIRNVDNNYIKKFVKIFIRIYLEIFSFIDENLFKNITNENYIIEINNKIKLFDDFFTIYEEMIQDDKFSDEMKIIFRKTLEYFNDFKIYLESLSFTINKINKNISKLNKIDKDNLYDFCIDKTIKDLKITIRTQNERLNCYVYECQTDYIIEIMDKIAFYMDIYTIAKILNDHNKKSIIYIYYSGGQHSENVFHFFDNYKKHDFDIIINKKENFYHNLHFSESDLSNLISIL